MRSIKILREKLAEGFGFLHVRRQDALWRGVDALMVGGRLWLTALGRDMPGAALEKHRIKAADRLLGNHALQAALVQMYRALAAWLLRRTPRPVVLVDWTGCGTGQYLLRAGVPFVGRSILLYGRVVPKSQLANRAVHREFLQTLADIVPPQCRPVIVTDAGFHHHWFGLVVKLGWDFVGRIRGRHHVRIRGQKLTIKQLFLQAGKRPTDLGIVEVGANRADLRRLILSAKPKSKGRRGRLTLKGTPSRRCVERVCARRAKEPWLLATSLTCSARDVVKIYATRMQVEESFRDLKSHRFGWAFCSARTKDPRRTEVLLMIATLAGLALSIVGAAAERRQLERQFQANTLRKRRVLSLITLGRRIIRTSIEISTHELRAALAAVRSTLEAANPLQSLSR